MRMNNANNVQCACAYVPRIHECMANTIACCRILDLWAWERVMLAVLVFVLCLRRFRKLMLLPVTGPMILVSQSTDCNLITPPPLATIVGGGGHYA